MRFRCVRALAPGFPRCHRDRRHESLADHRDPAVYRAREIGFTILSMTVSLVAVFIPGLFMGGTTAAVRAGDTEFTADYTAGGDPRPNFIRDVREDLEYAAGHAAGAEHLVRAVTENLLGARVPLCYDPFRIQHHHRDVPLRRLLHHVL